MHRGLEFLVAGLVYAAGGLCAGLLLYMRVFNRVRSPYKRKFGRGALGGLTLAGGAAGVWTGWTGWAWIPVLAVLLHVALEMSALRKRRRFRGQAPVEVLSPPAQAGRWFTTHALHIVRYEIPAPWGVAGPQIRIGHMSDLHIDDDTSRAYLKCVANGISEAAPDLLVLSGDFVDREPWSDVLADFLAGLHAPLGRFASLGNHDYAAGAETVRARLSEHGIHVLHGASASIEVSPGRFLAIVGDDRPWGAFSAQDTARPPGIPWIGLTHSPDNAFDFAKAGAFAAFCGHLHAGQIRFPWLGPAALPSRLSRCFEHGHYRIGAMHLFVSAGVGNTFPPFRFRCHPDILLVDVCPPDR